MKTGTLTKTVLFATFFLLLFSAASANPGGKEPAAKTVQKYFKFPSVLMKPATAPDGVVERVEVSFMTDAQGKVTFVSAKTSNRELKAEIEKQFYAMPFRHEQQQVLHKVVLRFRII